MMTGPEVKPIMDKLREAESMVLSILKDESRRDCWHDAHECQMQIWDAMDAIGKAVEGK